MSCSEIEDMKQEFSVRLEQIHGLQVAVGELQRKMEELDLLFKPRIEEFIKSIEKLEGRNEKPPKKTEPDDDPPKLKIQMSREEIKEKYLVCDELIDVIRQMEWHRIVSRLHNGDMMDKLGVQAADAVYSMKNEDWY